jgi:hypothetical protein
MASHDRKQWVHAQMTPFLPLDSMFPLESTSTTNYNLPAIPEEEGNLEWSEDWFTDPDPYACFEDNSYAVAETTPNEAVPHLASEDLLNLQRELQQLKHEQSELQANVFERINILENAVTVAQNYVKNLLTWSMKVHEQYSKVVEVAKRQEEGAADNVEVRVKATAM